MSIFSILKCTYFKSGWSSSTMIMPTIIFDDLKWLLSRLIAVVGLLGILELFWAQNPPIINVQNFYLLKIDLKIFEISNQLLKLDQEYHCILHCLDVNNKSLYSFKLVRLGKKCGLICVDYTLDPAKHFTVVQIFRLWHIPVCIPEYKGWSTS